MAAVQRRMQAAKCDSFLLIQTGHKFGPIKRAVKKVIKVVKKVAKKAVKFVGKAICAGLKLTYNIAKIPVDLATTALNEVDKMPGVRPLSANIYISIQWRISSMG